MTSHCDHSTSITGVLSLGISNEVRGRVIDQIQKGQLHDAGSPLTAACCSFVATGMVEL